MKKKKKNTLKKKKNKLKERYRETDVAGEGGLEGEKNMGELIVKYEIVLQKGRY